ncbi:MAG: saccharopine dehydrogenase family protein [Anaerolineae bacterium]
MTVSFLLYGATGYTGSLTARTAVQRGLRPILAGRNPARVEALAAELGLEWRAFSLDDGPMLERALREVPVVLHCAGPYSQTYKPMADACLRTGTHYLDITGEMSEHIALAGRDEEARAAGVMLLPSVGFDVVPSDCLALHLKRRLPTATHLTLAFHAVGGWSRGTMISAIDTADRPGMIRRGGVLVPVPAAWKTRAVDFGAGPVLCVTIPWGDLATAYRSTGIPNIETYMALPGLGRMGLKAAGLFGRPWGKRLLLKLAQLFPVGPGETQRATGYSLLWGEVTDDAGRRAAARMRTPHAYTLTALAALAAVERVLAGDIHPGYQTPASAYGPDFALTLPGVTRTDEP